jgi:hydrogenase maturation protease
MKKKTLIIGLGNTILSDDGAGILAAREIAKQCRELSDIDIVEASLGGIGLLDLMVGYKKVIIVDSIKTVDGKPGEIYKIDLENLGDITYPCGPHFLDVRTAVELGNKFGYEMPENIEIYAIEIKDNTNFSEILTPEVENALPALVNQIMTDQGLVN